MLQIISKSQFKPQVLEYLRLVEKTHKSLIITHAGKPVIKVVAYTEKPKNIINDLRQSVIKFVNPTEPVDKNEWEALA